MNEDIPSYELATQPIDIRSLLDAELRGHDEL
jgi:hypothetical protein